MILLASRNTIAENMERKSGSVRNAQRSMLFNQIGRLILRPVEQENIDVIVEPFSQGNSFYSCLFSLRKHIIEMFYLVDLFYLSVLSQFSNLPFFINFYVSFLCYSSIWTPMGIHRTLGL